MNLTGISARGTSALLATVLAGATFAYAQPPVAQTQEQQIATLQAALAAQQKQLETLQKALEQQQKMLQSAMSPAPAAPAALGTVASLTPVVPAPAPAPFTLPSMTPVQTPAAPASGGNPCEAGPDNAVPPYLRLGNVCITPVGFMDMTAVWRDKNAGSGIGSNFGGVPYNNTVNGNLSEFRFSPQNSRIGFRIDGDWKGAHFIGYNEFDFLGTSGSSALQVTNGAVVPRLRLFWVDVRKDKLEFLAGQSWSMLTPNRSGISALPSDIFYSQVIDVNYMAGLTWTRQPGMRVLYHPNEKVTFGFSAEQPDAYIGGSAGGSTSVLPSTYSALSGTQLDAASTFLGSSALAPDLIAKVAFDPSSKYHFEVAGIESTFKTVNPSLLSQHFGKTGGGLQFGGNAEIVKGLRVISTNFLSDGDGRYLFGQAPDLIVRGDGSLSLVHAYGTVDGFEETIKNTLLYTYYGGIYIGRDSAYASDGKTLVGYGYSGSANSQNRAINEFTFGFNQTMWKNARYGAINLMGQYEYLTRDPWFVAIGSPKNTHDNTIYINIRYSLPGSAPKF
jgi:hypothetical protein